MPQARQIHQPTTDLQHDNFPRTRGNAVAQSHQRVHPGHVQQRVLEGHNGQGTCPDPERQVLWDAFKHDKSKPISSIRAKLEAIKKNK
eukprot:1816325-Prymnesium_polylepis.1